MFDAFCYFPSEPKIKGETQDKDYGPKGKKAFEIISFEIGAENNINIGSISSGGGAGKATFKELTITKKTDTSSTELFRQLVSGNHFKDMTIDLRRSGGTSKGSGLVFLKFEFKLVMLQDISWSGSDGDDICEETIVLQYGAMKVTYTAQKADGGKGDESDAEWSRVLNQANFAVE